MRAESFSHILVSSVLFVDQVVRSCDVVVPVCLQAADRVIFFEAIIFNQFSEEVLAKRHFL